MNTKITIYNSIFSTADKVTLVEDFKLERNSINGSISIDTIKGDLLFDVLIPLSYPMGSNNTSIKFIAKNFYGYEHQNTDASVCLHPEANIDIKEKLNEELKLLFNWIELYYIQEERDKNYVYLQHQTTNICMIFDDVNYNKSKSFGEFRFVDYSTNNNRECFLALDIGDKKCKWASRFFEIKEKHEGIWVYIENEPIIRNAQIALKWSELQRYFTKEQIDFIYSNKRTKFNNKNIFLMLGYKIPNSNEIHWMLIFIKSTDIIIKSVKKNKQWYGIFENTDIRWSISINNSYNRFFGRGRFSPKITEKKILIIGIGAIGSSLTKILVRGGVKNIDIMDYDYVESGNICRSEFYTDNVGSLKVMSMMQICRHISPFININPIAPIKTIKGSVNYTESKKILSNYDIIFDCSTDMEVAYMLDKMSLNSEIFNFSITDLAKEFVCVYGRTNITIKKEEIFKKYRGVNIPQIDFYPELGCGYPTFRANYNDINTLLNFAIKNINHKFDNDYSQSSFVLTVRNDSININIEVDEK